MKRLIIFIMIIFTALALGGCRHKRPEIAENDAVISVRTASARIGTVVSTVEVSGDIKALNSAVLSAKISGRAVAVPFREGDYIKAGSVVVQQDTSDLNTQVSQADAGLQAARARLSQAATAANLSDTQIESGVIQAQASLDAAKARLQMIKKGARDQEVATAKSAVASAEANYKNAQLNLKRMRDLFAEGALSKQQMDLVQMQYDVAKAQYETAKQQLSLVQAGARDEEVIAAEKQVEQAEEALRVAKSNRANKVLREEDVNSARAGVAQAEAALAYARQQLENAQIKSPISGIVSKRHIEPGEMASPGIPLIEVVNLGSIYFEASISEIDYSKVKPSQPVEVLVDAYTGRKFRGTVNKILPTADSDSRQFSVRIQVLNPSGALKPGMFARGSIEVDRHINTIVIPKDALITSEKGQAVYIVNTSTARLKQVQVGFETREDAEILSGISAGDELVILGQDQLSDGVKVNVAN